MRLLLTMGLALILAHSPMAVAEPDAERETLARLVHELELLRSLVDQSEATADPDARIRFRYDWLRSDLDRVREGIEEHIDAPRSEPRKVAPLRGDYRR